MPDSEKCETAGSQYLVLTLPCPDFFFFNFPSMLEPGPPEQIFFLVHCPLLLAGPGPDTTALRLHRSGTP